MTLEELQAKIKELEGSLESQIDANKTLGADLKAAKEKLRKGQEIDPVEFNTLQAENEKLKTELAKVTKDLTKVTGERDNLAKTLETEVNITNKSTVESVLTAGFLEAGVKDKDYIDLLTGKHSAGAKVVIDGDKRKVMFGDKDSESYFKEWKATEAAKKFIDAPANSGGGSQGGGGQQTTEPKNSVQKIAAGLAKLK